MSEEPVVFSIPQAAGAIFCACVLPLYLALSVFPVVSELVSEDWNSAYRLIFRWVATPALSLSIWMLLYYQGKKILVGCRSAAFLAIFFLFFVVVTHLPVGVMLLSSVPAEDKMMKLFGWTLSMSGSVALLFCVALLSSYKKLGRSRAT